MIYYDVIYQQIHVLKKQYQLRHNVAYYSLCTRDLPKANFWFRPKPKPYRKFKLTFGRNRNRNQTFHYTFGRNRKRNQNEIGKHNTCILKD